MERSPVSCGVDLKKGRIMRRLAYLAAFSLVAMLMVAPYAGAQSGETVTVSIQDFFFDSAELTVEPGTTVQWVNEGEAPHDATSTDGGPLASGTLQTGETFSFTFEEAGTYEYFCSIHPDMTASVTVSEDEPDDSGASMADDSAVAPDSSAATADGSGMVQYGDDGMEALPETGGAPVTLPLAALLLLIAGTLGFVTLRRTL